MNNTRILLTAIALLPVLALSGCTTSTSEGGATAPAFTGPATPTSTRLTLLAVDYSKSTEQIRSQLLTTAFNIGTGFDQTHDTMLVYRFGHNIEEVYSHLPEDDDAFALVLAKYMKSSDPVLGTDYPSMLQRLAKDAEDATEGEIRIVIAGDGLNDFAGNPDFDKHYRDAAMRLSQNPRIKWLRFWGVGVGTREEIRSVFKPFGRRLQIMSLDQNPLAP